MYNLGFTLFSPTYLPFFSKSGTGIIVMYALMGLVLSVYRNTNIIKEKSAGTIPKYRIRIERIL
jgi:cell division protein FtsW (lipid II flippase)